MTFKKSLLLLLVLAGCGGQTRTKLVTNGEMRSQSLVEARKGFRTRLIRRPTSRTAVDRPTRVFQIVQYKSPVGQLPAYLTTDPGDGKQHPAIIWITGGECNSIGDVWNAGPSDNEQTASAYRKNGIVMMFPSLRGGNENPGQIEGFLGEVDDILAAADFLAKQKFVDPTRIYLGGHSTGGTLALFVSECSDRFRAVFSFGPVDNVVGYGAQYVPVDLNDAREIELRLPAPWLATIKSPTFVIEGSDGNIQSLQTMARINTNPQVKFIAVQGTDHFGILAPVNGLIAGKVLQDSGPSVSISLEQQEINRLFGR